MSNLKKMNRSQRKRAAKEHVYKTKGKGPCPYPEGSADEKFWMNARQHYRNMEAVADELAQAYGEFRPEHLSKNCEDPVSDG